MKEPDEIHADSLLADVLDEFTERCLRGDAEPIERYVERYPAIASVLQDVLPTVQALACRSSSQATQPPSAHLVGASSQSVLPVPNPSLAWPLAGQDQYKLIREIGQGGMGIVYAAIDQRLHRQVAVKFLRPQFCTAARIQRVQTEALAMARVVHPNIVQIYEFSGQGENPYLVLEFCEGGDLSRRTQGQPQSPAVAAELILKICSGLDVAHQAGLIHRDIKPENILFDSHDTPKLGDFGLVKHLDLDQDLTQVGTVLGTPSYMAPEQAEGKALPLTWAADIYSLGAVLYELLVGCPPFKGDSALETLQQVKTLEPVPPRRLRPTIPRDLETICLKCLRKEPQQRYSSAKDLARDLENYLANRPIEARRVTWPERLWKFTRRNPSLTTVSLLLTLSILSGALGVTMVSSRLEAQARHRQTQTQLKGLANAILLADINRLPSLLSQCDENLEAIAGFLLEQERQAKLDETQQLNLSLALLPREPNRRDKIWERLWDASPQELMVLADRLSASDPYFNQHCWEYLQGAANPPTARLRAAAILANRQTTATQWRDRSIGALVANQLVRVSPGDFGVWRTLFAPIIAELTPALDEIRSDRQASEQPKLFAIDILCDQAARQPARLLELLTETDSSHFHLVLKRMQPIKAEVYRTAKKWLVDTQSQLPLHFERVQWTQKQAKVAIMLLHFGHDQDVWPLLKHTDQPDLRSYLIQLLPELDAPIDTVYDRLIKEEDSSIRFALLLVLCQYLQRDDSLQLPLKLIDRLRDWYDHDSSPAIHSALVLLRKRYPGQGLSFQDEPTVTLDEALRQQCDWFVNSQGQLYSIIQMEPFQMGSDDQEVWRDHDERPHLRQVHRRFAISATEVTREAVLRWQPDYEIRQRGLAVRPECPVGSMGWYDAAGFCNWLSQQEGIPEDQWCYMPNDQGQYAKGMRAKEHFLELTGYRLPTEAEWEFACRSGTSTQRFFGNSDDLLPLYAWHSPMAGDQCHEVGQLLPNDFGLFDILGNQFEWCHDVYYDYGHLAKSTDPLTLDDPGDIEVTFDDQRRSLRGGSFEYTARHARSAYRSFDNLNNEVLDNGFRTARTLPR